MTTECYTIQDKTWSKGTLEHFIQGLEYSNLDLKEDLGKVDWTLWETYGNNISLYTSCTQQGYFFEIDFTGSFIFVFVKEYPDVLFLLKEIGIPYSMIGFTTWRRIADVGSIDEDNTDIFKITPMGRELVLFESYKPILTSEEKRAARIRQKRRLEE